MPGFHTGTSSHAPKFTCPSVAGRRAAASLWSGGLRRPWPGRRDRRLVGAKALRRGQGRDGVQGMGEGQQVPGEARSALSVSPVVSSFFFKQKTAYEITV